jgi:uncharacterized membrane protein
MEGMSSMIEASPNQRRIAPLTVVLGIVFVFFCAILVFVFVATKRASPVMLDEQGKPINASGGSR